jgi:hypothetical protein
MMIGRADLYRRNMNRSLREKRVQAGLEDMSDGGLGDVLRLWNEEYFAKQGLFVHLELSESVAKNEGKVSNFRKPSVFYSKPEDRKRKQDERKFMVVVTKLDEEGNPTEALHELDPGDDGNAAVEIGSSGEATSQAVELPAETVLPVELPANDGFADEKKETKEYPVGYVEMDASEKKAGPEGYVEMSVDNSNLLEKMRLKDG